MTIADTSVWIELLAGREHWTTDRLRRKLLERENLATIELIFLELVQGIPAREDRELLESNFQPFLLLPCTRSTTMLAAEIYQEMREQGRTIRSIVDCLISAAALETGATILHKDRDFDYIAEVYPLRVELE